MKKGSQHMFLEGAVPIPDVKKGNKFSIPGGKDATPDRLPTTELVENIPSAPAPNSRVSGRGGTGPGMKSVGLRKKGGR